MNIAILHRLIWKLSLVFAVLRVIGAIARRGTSAKRPGTQFLAAGPMLQNTTTNGFTVVWWQPGGVQGVLQVRGGLNVETNCQAIRRGDRCEARATGLASGTAYRYEILELGPAGSRRCLYVGRARTAPPPNTPFSFLVFGDSGSGDDFQYRLARVMDGYPCDLVLHTGDLVYGDVSPSDYVLKFFQPYRNFLRAVPFYPALGNHDVEVDGGQAFLEKFSLPTNGPPVVPAQHCYWFDYGDARFIVIDSNLDPATLSETVAPWLRRVLQTAGHRWKFIFFHAPPWNGGRHPADENVRAALVPTLEESGTDVVFCGHNHLYERTRPLHNGQAVAPTNGVLYITTGAGGKSLHKENYRGSSQLAFYDNSQFSFTWVQVTSDRVEIEQIGETDTILDKVVLAHTL